MSPGGYSGICFLGIHGEFWRWGPTGFRGDSGRDGRGRMGDPCEFSTGAPWGFRGGSAGDPRGSAGVPRGFPWGFRGGSARFRAVPRPSRIDLEHGVTFGPTESHFPKIICFHNWNGLCGPWAEAYIRACCAVERTLKIRSCSLFLKLKKGRGRGIAGGVVVRTCALSVICWHDSRNIVL